MNNYQKILNYQQKQSTEHLEKLQNNESIQFTLIYDPSKIEGFLCYAVVAVTQEDIPKMLKKFEDEFGEDYLMKSYS